MSIPVYRAVCHLAQFINSGFRWSLPPTCHWLWQVMHFVSGEDINILVINVTCTRLLTMIIFLLSRIANSLFAFVFMHTSHVFVYRISFCCWLCQVKVLHCIAVTYLMLCFHCTGILAKSSYNKVNIHRIAAVLHFEFDADTSVCCPAEFEFCEAMMMFTLRVMATNIPISVLYLVFWMPVCSSADIASHINGCRARLVVSK